MKNIDDIFSYSDYKTFLKDFFEWKKSETKSFTHRTFSELCGFTSSSALLTIMDGSRSLTLMTGAQIADGLRFKKNIRDYFMLMVKFSLAANAADQKKILSQMDSFRAKNRPDLITPKQYDYLKSWLPPVLREMIVLKDFSYDSIKSQLRFPIKAEQIQDAWNLLVDLGFISQSEDGKWVKKEATLATGNLLDNTGLMSIMRSYHLGALERAHDSVKNLPKEERNVSTTTLSFSEEGYKLAVERIARLRFELLEIAQKDQSPTNVYELSSCLYPMTKNLEQS
jgi:uncharacterized protein (TIGR02147 family)